MSTRRHRMPFGAELAGPDGVRFRLWAPAARRVDLVLHGADGPACQPMAALPDGWFELVTREAAAGSRYAFRIDGGLVVPDPASRANPDDVHGPSVVVDPEAFAWKDDGWRGRPWHEAVIYELHVGTFSPEGSFAGVERRLDALAHLGITVLELMPVAAFRGSRGWGYDGVLPFAPEASYGPPERLKALVDAAHQRGLAVMLDVVYNHFGPEGNYLHAYAPQFFSVTHQTPWGQAINFDGPGSETVRDFFLHNALYWLEEYHFDGLRIDAVHAFRDDSETHFLTTLAGQLRAGPGRDRPLLLVLENHANEARYLAAPDTAGRFDGQWNDDFHHALHVLVTGETDGYYADFAADPHGLLARCLAEGFAFQGERSAHGGGEPRGESSAHLPPTAFVPFLQTHDQVGNRALGDRLWQAATSEEALVAATAILLLAPAPPLFFMGDEWAADEPFLYFCDYEGDLARAVREGRRREFARFERFRDPAGAAAIPDPVSADTFVRSRPDWDARERGHHGRWLQRYRELLALRQREIVPLLPGLGSGTWQRDQPRGVVAVHWPHRAGGELRLLANLAPAAVRDGRPPAGRLLHTTHPGYPTADGTLPPWHVSWWLTGHGAG